MTVSSPSSSFWEATLCNVLSCSENESFSPPHAIAAVTAATLVVGCLSSWWFWSSSSRNKQQQREQHDEASASSSSFGTPKTVSGASREWMARRHQECAAIVQDRPLSALETKYFETGVGTFYLIVSCAMDPPSDELVQAIVPRVVATSPVLASRIQTDKDSGTAKFRLIDDFQAPQPFSVYDVAESAEVVPRIVAESERRVQAMLAGETAATRRFGSVLTVRGPRQSALGIVTSHAFADGAGASAFLYKIFVYLKAPRFLWPLIDGFGMTALPPFLEMVLKKEYARFVVPSPTSTTTTTVSSLGSPLRHKLFANFDPHSPAAKDQVQFFDEDLMRHIPSKLMKECRNRLRQHGITVTTAFAALSAKVYLSVVAKHQSDEVAVLAKQNPDEVVYISTPLDARSLGQWPKGRKQPLVPEIACYAFKVHTAFTRDELVREPLVAIAGKIRSDIKRLQSDAAYRFAKTCQSIHPETTSDCQLGCSSLNMEFQYYEPPNFVYVSKMHTGNLPKVWFMIYTHFRMTGLRLESCLPLPNVTPASFRKELLEATLTHVKDTPLECLFENFSPNL